MNLMQCILTANECYTTGRTIKVKGVMVHSTGANNPNLKRYAQPIASTPGQMDLLSKLGANLNGNHWNQFRPDGRQVCVHGFIGRLADGSVATVQTLPWNWRGWHCAGKANDTHIGFEICEDGLTDPVYFGKVYREAVELTAMLCKQYGLNPLADGVVICHQEGYRRGIASNHGDVLNWFPKFGKSMDDFRADVSAEMAREATPAPAPIQTPTKEKEKDMTYYKMIADVPAWYKDAVQKAMNKGALSGTGNGINVSEDMCRILTVLDRLGKLD